MLTYRDDGPWGSGKGSPLTVSEGDHNIYQLDSRVSELEENPPEAVSIASIDVTSNLLTITMTDSSTFGPFTLPTAQWSPKGEWAANTNYFRYDIVTNQGAVYLIRFTHTSDASFDPEADQGDGFLYARLMEAPSLPYDVSLFYDTASIPNDGRLILQHISVRDYYFSGDFAFSQAFLRVAPATVTLVFEIRKADKILETETLIGTLTFDPSFGATFDGGMYGVFAGIGSPVDDIQMSAGDRLNVYTSSSSPDDPDATAAGLSLTIYGLTGTLE